MKMLIQYGPLACLWALLSCGESASFVESQHQVAKSNGEEAIENETLEEEENEVIDPTDPLHEETPIAPLPPDVETEIPQPPTTPVDPIVLVPEPPVLPPEPPVLPPEPPILPPDPPTPPEPPVYPEIDLGVMFL